MTSDSTIEIYARRRDPEAFRSLVDEYEGLVFRTCRRMLSRADTEDAVQDVFVKLMQNASTIRGDLPGWLHRCAVNTCLDQIRRDKARRNREDQSDTLPSTETPETEERLAAALLKDVDEALLQLDDGERSLIIRYYLNNESQQSIANELSVSQPTVARRLDRSLTKLRSLLDKRGVAASAVFIASTLGSSSASAEVPAALSKSLAKLALASHHNVVSSIAPVAKKAPWAFILKLSTLPILALIGAVVWSFVNGVDQRERAVVVAPPPVIPFPEVEYETFPAQTFFQHEYVLDNLTPLEELVDDLKLRAEQAGVTVQGRPVFRHPEGLGPEEITLIIAVPVAPETELSPDIVRADSFEALTLAADPRQNPYGAISQVDEAVSQRGFERTYKDRFVPFDTMYPDTFAFKVILGVKSSFIKK